MMLILLVLTLLLLLIIGGTHFLLSWTFADMAEDAELRQARSARSFYDPRTWAAYRRLVAQRPALLSYRRDRRGRFRKMR